MKIFALVFAIAIIIDWSNQIFRFKQPKKVSRIIDIYAISDINEILLFQGTIRTKVDILLKHKCI